MKTRYDALIIGGGFFGMYIAEYLSVGGKKILLCEKENDFMKRASTNNQARVHSGYHYPRSLLTALRSRILFPRFCEEFSECIDRSFEKYYLIGKLLGKVTARQFEKFCRRIGAPCELAPPEMIRLTNPDLIEAAFKTTEYAFNAVKLKEVMQARLKSADVEYRHSTMVKKVAPATSGLKAMIKDLTSDQEKTVEVNQTYNCAYSMINYILSESGLEIIPLKHELTEICLVEVPEEIRGMGFTVVCGPFFSTMPFPPRGLHSFSHARYTPHYEWHDAPQKQYINAHAHLNTVEKKTRWEYMRRDAMRYLPILGECRYKESIWEVKTVLPRSESDDSRPILFMPDCGLKGFHCIMGGKIDNIYDAINYISQLGLNR